MKRARRTSAQFAACVAVVAMTAGTCGDDDSSVTTFLAPPTSTSEVPMTDPTTVSTTPPTSGTTNPSDPGTTSVPASSVVPATSVVASPSGSFPVAISESGRYVVDSSGAPWFMVGDAGWSSVVMLDEAEIAYYFDALEAKGFNTVLVNIVETHYSDHTPFNVNGDGPFTGGFFQSEPNEAYWEWVDRYVQAAAERGITLLATPAYLGFHADGVALDVEASSNEQLLEYGRFLGTRYADASNIIWVIGGDRTDVSDDLLERMDSMATGIRETAPQLITAHIAQDSNAADVFGEYQWLDIDNSYDANNEPVAEAIRSYEREPVRPTFSVEGIYEQERDQPLEPGAQQLRYQAYGAVLAGSFGHVFGNNPRWHFEGAPLFPFEGTWEESLDDPDGDLDLGTVHMGYFGEIFRSLDWQNLVPDTADEFLVDGEGDGSEQAAAAVDANQGIGAVYTVSTSTIELDLTRLSAAGQVVVRRVDPTTNESIEVGTYPTDGTQSFEHPGDNAHGDDDWLYIVEPA